MVVSLALVRVMLSPPGEGAGDEHGHEPVTGSWWAALRRPAVHAAGTLEAAGWLLLLIAFENWWLRLTMGDLTRWGVAALAAFWGGSALLEHLRTAGENDELPPASSAFRQLADPKRPLPPPKSPPLPEEPSSSPADPSA